MKPSIKIGCASNIYIRSMTFHNIEDIETGVITDFDHIALLSSGSVEITVKDIITSFDAPHMILIKRGLDHKFKALEANTVIHQIHTIRETSSDNVLDPLQIPYEANPRLVSSRPL
jgi:hypothetical protein